MVLSESADLFEFAGDAVELTHRGSLTSRIWGHLGFRALGLLVQRFGGFGPGSFELMAGR